jgi:hypothetical protein
MRAPARQPEGTVAPGSGQRDGMGPGAAHASAWQGLAGVRPVTENPGFLPFI